MYSKEFMKFLYGYQKEDFKKKDSQEISFKDKKKGKPAKVYVTISNSAN